MWVLFVVLCVVQAQSVDDDRRVADPCHPSPCQMPNICIRIQCPTGMCPKCTQSIFVGDPPPDLANLAAAAGILGPPTPSSLGTPPLTSPPLTSPALISRPPDPTLGLPSTALQSRPQAPSPTASTVDTSVEMMCSLLGDCAKCTQTGACQWSTVGLCGGKCPVQPCVGAGQCPGSSGQPATSPPPVQQPPLQSRPQAPLVPTPSSALPPVSSCAAASCAQCTALRCYWTGGACKTMCDPFLPCASTFSSCPPPDTSGSPGTSANPALSPVTPATSPNPPLSLISRPGDSAPSSPVSPPGNPRVCGPLSTCGSCTSQGCKWSMNSCNPACLKNKEDNIICWDSASSCPGECVTCPPSTPGCAAGCQQCQQIGQTCKECAKFVCLDNQGPGGAAQGGSPQGVPQGSFSQGGQGPAQAFSQGGQAQGAFSQGSSSQGVSQGGQQGSLSQGGLAQGQGGFPQGSSQGGSQCSLGMPCEACDAAGCVWSISTGCIPCTRQPCVSPCSKVGTGSFSASSPSGSPSLPSPSSPSSPSLPSSPLPSSLSPCRDDSQCSSKEFCSGGRCQEYAQHGMSCSLTGTPRCLPPGLCVFVANPFLFQDALKCAVPGLPLPTATPQPSTPALPAPQSVPPQQQVQVPASPFQQPTTPQAPLPSSLSLSQKKPSQSSFSPCCRNTSTPGCPGDPAVQACVCGVDDYCCNTAWDGGCVELAARTCSIQCPACDATNCADCISNGCRWVIPDNNGAGQCASSCASARSCHTSTCPDPGSPLLSPIQYSSGQYSSSASLYSSSASPYSSGQSSSSQSSPNRCPAVDDCSEDKGASECQNDSDCGQSEKCCLQIRSDSVAQFLIQPAMVRSAQLTREFRSDSNTCVRQCVAKVGSPCQTDADCPPSQFCAGGTQCTPYQAAGMSCSSDLHCFPSLVCDYSWGSGVCVPPSSVVPPAALPASSVPSQGASQGVSAQMPSIIAPSQIGSTPPPALPTRSRPDPSEMAPVSVSKPAAAKCSTDFDCGSDRYCQAPKCVAFNNEGQPCTDASPVLKCLAPLTCFYTPGGTQGVCRPVGFCRNNADCQMMEQCADQRCVPLKQSCCEVSLAKGCDDSDVQDCTCRLDSGCCNVNWDKSCVQLAQERCAPKCALQALYDAPGFGVDPCCGLQKIGGCGNSTLEACVCQEDDFCCDRKWDYKCISIGTKLCNANCPASTT